MDNPKENLDTLLVACETIEDEIRQSLAKLNLNYGVVWLEGGLHNSPDRLRKRLQEIFDQADGQCQRLLVSLGFCGGGVSGLSTGGYQTVLPLADDCLSLLLGSVEARRLASRPATFFLTAGWMRHENNIISSYSQTVARFGQNKADRVNKLMYRNYRRFGLVNTGCYDLRDAARRIRPLAHKMNMTVEEIGGDRGWLTDLLTGPHNDPNRFLVLKPRSELDFNNWSSFLMGETVTASEGFSGVSPGLAPTCP